MVLASRRGVLSPGARGLELRLVVELVGVVNVVESECDDHERELILSSSGSERCDEVEGSDEEESVRVVKGGTTRSGLSRGSKTGTMCLSKAGSRNGSNMGLLDSGVGVASGVESGVWNVVSSSESLTAASSVGAGGGWLSRAALDSVFCCSGVLF